MVTAVVTEVPRRLEPVIDDVREFDAASDAERQAVLARIAVLFGTEPRRAIVD